MFTFSETDLLGMFLLLGGICLGMLGSYKKKIFVTPKWQKIFQYTCLGSGLAALITIILLVVSLGTRQNKNLYLQKISVVVAVLVGGLTIIAFGRAIISLIERIRNEKNTRAVQNGITLNENWMFFENIPSKDIPITLSLLNKKFSDNNLLDSAEEQKLNEITETWKMKYRKEIQYNFLLSHTDQKQDAIPIKLQQQQTRLKVKILSCIGILVCWIISLWFSYPLTFWMLGFTFLFGTLFIYLFRKFFRERKEFEVLLDEYLQRNMMCFLLKKNNSI